MLGWCQGDAELLSCDGEAHEAGGGGKHSDEGGEEQCGQVGQQHGGQHLQHVRGNTLWGLYGHGCTLHLDTDWLGHFWE